jgi:DNA-binding SARP family transcriptional activator
LADPPALRIQLCGGIAVVRGRERLESGLPGPQGRRLFAYLVVNRRRAGVTREQMADALWADAPPASHASALNALLSKVRRVADPARLPAATIVDLEAAHDAIHRAESALALGEWARAWGASQAAMFTARRGFLPGEEGDWIDEQRRALEELHLRALEAYAAASLHIAGTELPAAERVGRELIRLQPYRESGYRFLMEALAAQSNVAQALQVYEGLRRRLQEELGIAPSPATRGLHEQLLSSA